jgi:hypothetical protein
VDTPVALLTLPFALLLKELPLRDDAYIRSATVSAVGGEPQVESLTPVS